MKCPFWQLLRNFLETWMAFWRPRDMMWSDSKWDCQGNWEECCMHKIKISWIMPFILHEKFSLIILPFFFHSLFRKESWPNVIENHLKYLTGLFLTNKSTIPGWFYKKCNCGFPRKYVWIFSPLIIIQLFVSNFILNWWEPSGPEKSNFRMAQTLSQLGVSLPQKESHTSHFNPLQIHRTRLFHSFQQTIDSCWLSEPLLIFPINFASNQNRVVYI